MPLWSPDETTTKAGFSDLPASLPAGGWPGGSYDSERFRYTWEYIYQIYSKMQDKLLSITWEQLENPKSKK
jgi:hypothetical protein